MNRTIFLLCISLLILSGCTNSNNQESGNKKTSPESGNNVISDTISETKQAKNSSSDNSVNQNDSYSGEWINWNNPENEADGGVSLKIAVNNNELTGNFSAWSKNYGRLADSDISGTIQDDICEISFEDDARGHSGTILLTFNLEQITADVSIQTQDADFTFPLGTTVLHKKIEQSLSKSATPKDAPTPSSNPDNLENDTKILLRGSTETSSITLTYGMSYDDVNRLLDSIGEETTKYPWEEYSNYTLINQKELWNSIQSVEDFNSEAILQKTLINSDKQYTFIFITQNNETILTSILIGTPAIESTKNIKCGDFVSRLTEQYGSDYTLYSSAQYEIYEYKASAGYVRFFLDPATKLIVEWGIDTYSYQDHTDMKNKLEDISSH